MKTVAKYSPDFLGLYYYGTDDKDAVVYLKRMHQKYPDYIVIVSEIASTSREQNKMLEFTTKPVN